MGAWVLLERNDKYQTGGAVRGGGQNSPLQNSEAQQVDPNPEVSRGRALSLDVCIVHHVDWVAILASVRVVLRQSRSRWPRYTVRPSVVKRTVLFYYLVRYEWCLPRGKIQQSWQPVTTTLIMNRIRIERLRRVRIWRFTNPAFCTSSSSNKNFSLCWNWREKTTRDWVRIGVYFLSSSAVAYY